MINEINRQGFRRQRTPSLRRTLSAVAGGAAFAQHVKKPGGWELVGRERYHFAICNQLASDSQGNSAKELQQQLAAVGCSVLYLPPNASAVEIEAVRSCRCLLLFLGGRQSAAEYRGLFSSHCCHEQVRIAQEAELKIIGALETDADRGVPDFGAESRSCLEGQAEAARCAWVLKEVCFVPRRTEPHEIAGFVTELLQQGLSK